MWVVGVHCWPGCSDNQICLQGVSLILGNTHFWGGGGGCTPLHSFFLGMHTAAHEKMGMHRIRTLICFGYILCGANARGASCVKGVRGTGGAGGARRARVI